MSKHCKFVSYQVPSDCAKTHTAIEQDKIKHLLKCSNEFFRESADYISTVGLIVHQLNNSQQGTRFRDCMVSTAWLKTGHLGTCR